MLMLSADGKLIGTVEPELLGDAPYDIAIPQHMAQHQTGLIERLLVHAFDTLHLRRVDVRIHDIDTQE